MAHVRTTVLLFCTEVQDIQYTYEACLGSKDTKVLNMYNIFNLQKRHCE